MVRFRSDDSRSIFHERGKEGAVIGVALHSAATLLARTPAGREDKRAECFCLHLRSICLRD